jgi:hypothetical protein
MDFFFYGTLRDADVRRQVLGRDLLAAQMEEAVLAGFSPLFVAEATYPTLVARPDGHAPGLLARRLGTADAARLAAFEGPAYCTRTLTVTGRRSGPVAARVFIIRGEARAVERPWSLDDWQRRFKSAFLAMRPFRPR